ncbi:hypothetical protein ACHAXA_009678 [Cyclostephanos tholiformis]|uniref:Uncharacterized protein n=1 Tax=Cyclostephanos tholiformis TaxID=382380 RepID=A0ABD3RHH2_9STRA
MLLTSPLDACGSWCLSEQLNKQTTKDRKSHVPATFIRVHDLDLTDEDRSRCSGGDECRSDVGSGRTSGSVANGGDILSINSDGSGAIMTALVVVALEEATDESSRWTPTGATDRILRERARQTKGCGGGGGAGGPMGPWANAASMGDVLVWSSRCTRKGHGSEYPVVKSRGLIPASARDVVDLVRDSRRVKEYNKMSIGREDELFLTTITDGSSSVHALEITCPRLGITGQAKVMSSRSQPPLTLKPLEFKTLIYARRLDSGCDGVELDGDAAAYVTVGRSTWETPDGTADGSDDSTKRCEILLSVNLVRDISSTHDGKEWCELTLITHAVSPGIPIFMGKQMGLVAAENYIKDIRALFES